jgi:hypothetical protein
VNLLYKIILKVLALRIQRFKKRIVRLKKTGFVQGIFSLDTVPTACECIEWARETNQNSLLLLLTLIKLMIQWTGVSFWICCSGLGFSPNSQQWYVLFSQKPRPVTPQARGN